MRSKLFVPASRPEIFAKAVRSDADAISLDLEDAVALQDKDAARAAIGSALSADVFKRGKTVIVRINSLESGLADKDLMAVARAGVDVINLPKVESTEAVRWLAAALSRLEEERGVARPIGILANIETPRGVRLSAEIAAAHPRLCGLQLGFADLFVPLGVDRKNVAAVNAIRLSVRLAAAEVGIPAYDGAFVDIADSAGFEADARNARALGFEGKSCIHPSQIGMANAVFGLTSEDVLEAQRIVDAAAAQADGQSGAFKLDGALVDRPFLERARATLARARGERSDG